MIPPEKKKKNQFMRVGLMLKKRKRIMREGLMLLKKQKEPEWLNEKSVTPTLYGRVLTFQCKVFAYSAVRVFSTHAGVWGFGGSTRGTCSRI
jgi:hypothetical protein